jgi:hypothetical protein
MNNRRYDYSPIIRRPKIEWPNHGRAHPSGFQIANLNV